MNYVLILLANQGLLNATQSYYMFYMISESSWPSQSSLSSSDTIIPLTNEHHVTNKHLSVPTTQPSESINWRDKHLAFCDGTMGLDITLTPISVVFNHKMISCGWPWGRLIALSYQLHPLAGAKAQSILTALDGYTVEWMWIHRTAIASLSLGPIYCSSLDRMKRKVIQ